MKNKITISLDENILSQIDNLVNKWEWKNRSNVIENILKEKYWDFIDVTVIIFAHDYKWDNRPYPFDVPKSLLEIKWKTIIARLLRDFSKPWIKNFIITIPKWTKDLFRTELNDDFWNLNLNFLEVDDKLRTGDALRLALKEDYTDKKLIIANGDILYWDLNLNLEEYYNYHIDQKSDFSFLLKFVLNPEQLWNVKINWNRIIEFVERPKASQMNLTNSWLYITTRNFLDKHNFWNYLEVDFFPNIASLWNIICYTYPNSWEHIQNDSAYERANWWLL